VIRCRFERDDPGKLGDALSARDARDRDLVSLGGDRRVEPVTCSSRCRTQDIRIEFAPLT
jgi:hypothetical protein